jgi:hypothetical protein
LIRRGWLLIADVGLVAVLAVVAFPSDGSAYAESSYVVLTASGPSPSTLTTGAGKYLLFSNEDLVPHTVAFPNEGCKFSVPPGYVYGPGGQAISAGQQQQFLPPACSSDFPFYVGSYDYTVDGQFAGMVVTTPDQRSVTLTARTHRVRRGERLTLHGEVRWDNTATPNGGRPPFPVIVLARYAGSQTFKAIATVTMPGVVDVQGSWHLKVRPGVATTYMAELIGQLHGGTIWRQAASRPFTVRIQP